MLTSQAYDYKIVSVVAKWPTSTKGVFVKLTDEIATGIFNPYIGGELEIQNEIENYMYRGKVATVSVTDGILKVKFAWLARAINDDGGNSVLPTNGWIEDDNLSYSLTLFVGPDASIPGDEGIQLVSARALDTRGLVISSGVHNELLVFFLPGKSQLNADRVRWLPEGPYAKHVAGDN